jgi:glutamate-1-semialdehyde aminotransferase
MLTKEEAEAKIAELQAQQAVLQGQIEQIAIQNNLVVYSTDSDSTNRFFPTKEAFMAFWDITKSDMDHYSYLDFPGWISSSEMDW